MRYLDLNAVLQADFQDFRDAVDFLLALWGSDPGAGLAPVGEENAVIGLQLPAHFQKLLRVREDAGLIVQAYGHTECTGVQCLVDMRLQLCRLRFGGLPVSVGAQHVHADGAVAQYGDNVAGKALGIDGIQPLVEGVPGGVKVAVGADQGNDILAEGVIVLVVHICIELGGQRIEDIPHSLIGQPVFADGGNGLAAHTAHKGGNTLVEHGVHGGITQYGLVRMGVHFNKAWGDDLAGGIYGQSRCGIGKVADGGDLFANNAHICPAAGGTGAVKNRAAQNQCIKVHPVPHFLSQTWWNTRIRLPPRIFWISVSVKPRRSIWSTRLSHSSK